MVHDVDVKVQVQNVHLNFNVNLSLAYIQTLEDANTKFSRKKNANLRWRLQSSGTTVPEDGF